MRFNSFTDIGFFIEVCYESLLRSALQIQKNFYDKRKYGGLSRPGLMPNYKPLLHKIQPKDPVEDENQRHVSLIARLFAAR